MWQIHGNPVDFGQFRWSERPRRSYNGQGPQLGALGSPTVAYGYIYRYINPYIDQLFQNSPKVYIYPYGQNPAYKEKPKEKVCIYTRTRINFSKIFRMCTYTRTYIYPYATVRACAIDLLVRVAGIMFPKSGNIWCLAGSGARGNGASAKSDVCRLGDRKHAATGRWVTYKTIHTLTEKHFSIVIPTGTGSRSGNPGTVPWHHVSTGGMPVQHDDVMTEDPDRCRSCPWRLWCHELRDSYDVMRLAEAGV